MTQHPAGRLLVPPTEPSKTTKAIVGDILTMAAFYVSMVGLGLWWFYSATN